MSQSPDAHHAPDDVDVDDAILAEARAEASGTSSASRADAAADADQPDPLPGPATGRSLWHDRNFLTLWSGQALSQFGAQIAELAIPVLAVLLLNATEFQIGVLNAANVAAFLLVGLPAGAWIDRMRKRHVMIAADVVRAAALALVPLLWILGVLQVWHLVVIAAIVGIATVFFDVSYQSIVPSLVPSENIAEANGKLESTQQLAGLTGPAIAGGLVGLITAPLAVLTTVGTYIVSMVALIRTRDHEKLREPEDHAPLHREIAEGLAWVFGNPFLRRIVGTTGISNLFSTFIFTLTPIYYLRIIGFSPEVIARLGEPYVTTRSQGEGSRSHHHGMGLGFFIAKTLLERTGAQVEFRNARGGGAIVSARWRRDGVEAQPGAAEGA